MSLFLLLNAVFTVGSLSTAAPVAAAPPTSVTEFQPTLNASNGSGLLGWGGRSVSITVKPGDDDTAIVASESGGLFRTTNGGTDWSHLDGLVPFRMADVVYAPSNASVVLASTFQNGDTTYPGGLWRSTDGGTTWTQPASARTLCAQPFSAWGIAFEPSSTYVFAGTDCGLAMSSDQGATWTLAAAGPRPAVALVASHSASNGTIDVCAPDGHRRYTHVGGTLTLVNGPTALGGLIGGCRSPWIHDLAGTPGDPNVLFAMDVVSTTSLCGASGLKPANVWQLFRTTDGGATWGAVEANNGIMCPSRPPQVATHAASSGVAGQFDIYFSGGLDIQRQTCTSGGGGNRCTGVLANGSNVTIPHADPSQVAFENGSGNCALYEISDGGPAKSTTCGSSFSMVGGSGAGGFNALQIYEGIAQLEPATTNLYFGTQDNDVWAADLGAAAGTTFNTIRGVCCEGFFFQTPRVDSGAAQVVNAVVCSGCNNVYFNNLYSGSGYNPGGSLWPEPVPAASNPGNPFLIGEGVYLETAHPDINAPAGADDGDPYNWYVGVLGTLGNPGTITWTQVTTDGTTALATNRLRGRPWISGPVADPTVYQPYCRSGCGGNEVYGLYRIEGIRSATATATVIDGALTGGLASYCNGQGTFVCPIVFNVNPNDPLDLIATDRVGSTDERMQVSHDGGQTWSVDATLTALVKGNGRFKGMDPNSGSQAHYIGWDPTDPSGGRILVGTEGAGIVGTFDGGATWSHLGGSERATAISSFIFGDPSREGILVTTYGRGIWKLAVPQADLRITKTHHPDPAIAGTQLYYDLSVRNNGPDDTLSTTVVDTLPPEVRYVTNTLPDPSACSVSSAPPGVSQVVTCELGPLANGGQIDFTIKVDVAVAAIAATGPRSITNTAKVLVGGVVDPLEADNTATDTVIVEDQADLEVTKVCTPSPTIPAGNPMDCTVFVDNHGPSTARAVVVDDTMLSDGTFTVSNESPALGVGTPGCTLTAVTGGQRLTCRLGDLDPASTTSSGRAVMTYRISATEGMTIDNVAVARSDTPDPEAENNTAVLPLAFTAVADLAIVKTAPATVDAGTNLTWTISVTNGGPSTAANVVMSDVLPPGVDYVSATVSVGPGSCTAGVPGDAAQPVACGLGSIAPGGSRTILVTVKVKPGTTGILGNDARVTSDTFDPNSANDLSHTDTTVVANVGLTLTMVASPDPVTSGTTLTIRSTAGNTGPSTATSVVLDLVLPPGTTYLGSTLPSGGACGLLTTSQLRCNLPDLGPGASVDVFVDVHVASGVEGLGTLVTAGTLSAAAGTPASSSVLVGTTRVSDLGVVLSSDNDVYKPSKIIHYAVIITNDGPSDASGVTFTLNLPPPKWAIYDSNDGGCPAPVGATMTCDVGIVRAGQTETVTVNVLIRGNKGTVTSDASVVSNGEIGSPASSDPVAGNNTSTRVVTVK